MEVGEFEAAREGVDIGPHMPGKFLAALAGVCHEQMTSEAKVKRDHARRFRRGSTWRRAIPRFSATTSV